ncbi:MAG: SRPBCC domain-containing protein [Methylocella sp.]
MSARNPRYHFCWRKKLPLVLKDIFSVFFGRTVDSDWKSGSEWILRLPGGRVDVKGRVVESDPARKLAVTWNTGWIEKLKKPPEAIVTYEIEPMGEVVRLTMTESHPAPIPDYMLEGGRRGWPVILRGLKSLLETGRLPKIPAPQPPDEPDR